MNRRTIAPLLLAAAAAVMLPGCWTPPTSNVQPPGPSRLIQKGIVVESVVRLAVVQSVDPATRMIVMQVPGIPEARAYKAGLNVLDLDRLSPGAQVRARVSEELTVYVSSDGRLPGATGAPAANTPTAKVLMLDPSYRLLTLQYPNGQMQTFKVGREVHLAQMQGGDDVMIQTPEVVSLSVRKH